jgi:hypothetical protein
MKRQLRSGVAVSLVVVLVACGGGGGSGIAPAPTDYNLQAGVTNMVAHGLSANVSLSGSVTVNGNSTPFTGSGAYSLAPSSNGTFAGTSAAAQVQTITGTVTAAGQTGPYTVTVTDYYASSNSAFLGEVNSDEYDVAQNPIQFPTSVVGGSSGVLGTLSRYSDQTMSVVLGTAELSYSVTAASSAGGPVKVALTTKSYDQQHTLTETDVTTYGLTTSSVISFVSGSVQNSSGTLMATAN